MGYSQQQNRQASQKPHTHKLEQIVAKIKRAVGNAVTKLNYKKPGIAGVILLAGAGTAIGQTTGDTLVYKITTNTPAYVQVVNPPDTLTGHTVNNQLILQQIITGINEGSNNQIATDILVSDLYPNANGGQTGGSYSIPHGMNIQGKLYNILGQTVQTIAYQYQKAGIHFFTIDMKNDAGEKLAAGIYFLQLKFGKEAKQIYKVIHWPNAPSWTGANIIKPTKNITTTPRQGFAKPTSILDSAYVTITPDSTNYTTFDSLYIFPAETDTLFINAILQNIAEKYDVIIQPQTPDQTNNWADIVIHFTNNDTTYTDTTQANGQANFPQIPPGTYTLDIPSDPRFRPLTDMRNIQNDTTLRPTILEKLVLGQTNFSKNEGDTLFLATSNWNYSLGLDSLLNQSPEFQLTKINDSTYALTTTNPNTNGNLIATILSTATHGTPDITDLNIAIQDMITIQGKLGDTHTWKNPQHGGDNTIEGQYGWIAALGDTAWADTNGIYSLRIPASPTPISIETRATLQDNTPRSYIATFDSIPANQDITDLLLHVVMYKYIEQNGLTPEQFKQWAYDINFAPRSDIPMNFEGLKTANWDSLNSHITRDSWTPDIFSVAEQNYLEIIERDSLYAHLQNSNHPIHKAALGEPIPHNRQGVRIWLKQIGAPSVAIVGDENTGIFSKAVIRVSSGTPTHLEEIIEEGYSGLIAPGEMFGGVPSYPYMIGKTVTHPIPPPGYGLSITDLLLLSIGQNYKPTTPQEKILKIN